VYAPEACVYDYYDGFFRETGHIYSYLLLFAHIYSCVNKPFKRLYFFFINTLIYQSVKKYRFQVDYLVKHALRREHVVEIKWKRVSPLLTSPLASGCIVSKCLYCIPLPSSLPIEWVGLLSHA
jgi:hypothetical protein